MNELGFAAAFGGGILTLVSPCSALLLPAFFAYAFDRPARLVARTGVFYLGLLATLVPLGAGSATVGALFTTHRTTMVNVAGGVIIALGVLLITGRGLQFGPLARLAGRLHGDSPASVFALGAVYGLAGACSGPILGAVLTISLTASDPIAGGLVLAVYALGMVVPLLLIALLWERLNLSQRSWLRGQELTMGRLRAHSTALVSGLLFIAIGMVFIVFDGTGTLGALVSTDTAYELDVWAQNVGNRIPDVAVPLAIIAIAAAVLVTRRRNHTER